MKREDNTQLVEVFTGSRWEAELIKGLLENSGIGSVVKDGIMGTLAPYISPEVSIMVSENDYEAAAEVIRDRDKEKAASNH
ncbi:MAG: DUF2007 domain-containing protein [Mediterranea sp.]|jgi:hypothetical protein|nr:DUF2007 domain-containing protein [Mediterranea sp.]